MRKIITKEERDRIVRRNQTVIGVVLIFLMVVSTLSFAFINKTSNNLNEEVEYKGIKFVRDETGFWSFNVQGNNFLTLYNPKETEDISFFVAHKIENYFNKPLYFAGDESHFQELARNLNGIALRISNACLEEYNCKDNKNFPVKDCSNNIVVFKELVDNTENTENKIYQQENCVFIEANYQEQARYSDAFLFGLLGINNNLLINRNK